MKEISIHTHGNVLNLMQKVNELSKLELVNVILDIASNHPDTFIDTMTGPINMISYREQIIQIVMNASSKIPAIKAVRELTRQGESIMGLLDAKNLVESLRSDW